MHVLDGERAAVGALQRREDLAQRQVLARLTAEGADREFTVEIPDRQTMGLETKILVAASAILERIGVGDEVTVGTVGVDELQHTAGLGNLRIAVRRDVGGPTQRLVGDTKGFVDLVVEAMLAEQQLVHDLQELARLGALDHAVIVGGGQRRHLGDAKLDEARGRHSLELGRVVDVADAEDEALTVHQARDRVVRADAARVGDRAGRASKVGDGQLAVAGLLDDLFVGSPELGEVEGLTALDVRDEKLTRAVVLLDVDRDAEVDRGAFDQVRLAVDHVVGVVHRRHGLDGLDHRVGDEVRERNLAALAGAEEVVDEGALVDDELHRHRANRRRSRDRQRRFHVLGGAHRGATEHGVLGLRRRRLGAKGGARRVR